MTVETLEFGQSVVGLLVDGVEGTAYTGATLHMEEPQGVVVEVPYIHRGDTEQFRHVDGWFETQTPPRNMKLLTHKGAVCLYDVEWRGHSVSIGVSLGKLAPSETLLGRRDAPLHEPLTVTEVYSHLDGLREWTSFTGLHTDPEADANGLATGLHVYVRSGEGASWQQGEATLNFATDWRTERPEENGNGGLNITDASVLVSKFHTARPFTDHLAEQRKVVQLLVLVAGAPISFRRHRVADDTIVIRSLGGSVMSHPRTDLLSAQTVRDYAQPLPTKQELGDLLTRFPDVGTDGMARWAEQYETWKRFILPAVGVLGRRQAFAEDLIVSTSMSIEAAGQIVGEREGETATYGRGGKPSTATYVYRCLNVLDLEWGDIAPNTIAISRAVANTYNTIKHFDKGEFPDTSVSHIVSTITKYIVRLLALHIVEPSGALLTEWRTPNAMWRVRRLLEVYKVSINEQGGFVVSRAEGDALDAEQ